MRSSFSFRHPLAAVPLSSLSFSLSMPISVVVFSNNPEMSARHSVSFSHVRFGACIHVKSSKTLPALRLTTCCPNVRHKYPIARKRSGKRVRLVNSYAQRLGNRRNFVSTQIEENITSHGAGTRTPIGHGDQKTSDFAQSILFRSFRSFDDEHSNKPRHWQRPDSNKIFNDLRSTIRIVSR